MRKPNEPVAPGAHSDAKDSIGGAVVHADNTEGNAAASAYESMRLPVENIPWGYGLCRVTALARDPDWLYVYWEITDEAIEQACKSFARTGDDLSTLHEQARICLRVYNTDGGNFDGALSGGFFDVQVERHARDAFVHVGRPNTCVHVEIGVSSSQGDFRSIARSGRADFPRKVPSDDRTVQWLTVEEDDRSRVPMPFTAPYRSRHQGPLPDLGHSAAQPAVQGAKQHVFAPTETVQRKSVTTVRRSWVERLSVAWTTRVSHRFETSNVQASWISQPWRSEWQGELRSFSWMQPLQSSYWSESLSSGSWRVSFESGAEFGGSFGPDSSRRGLVHQVSSIVQSDAAGQNLCERVVLSLLGTSAGQVSHQEFSTDGAWSVVIRSMAFGADQPRVLARWRLRFSTPTAHEDAAWHTMTQSLWDHLVVAGHVTTDVTASKASLQLSASEALVVGAASEQMQREHALAWDIAGASEMWLGSASEQLLIAGGSELSLQLFSASWLAQLQASEQWMSAASEQWMSANSELWLSSASEQWLSSASEQWMSHASEQWLSSASEQWMSHASEQWLTSVSSQISSYDWVRSSLQPVGDSSELWSFSSDLLLTSASDGLGVQSDGSNDVLSEKSSGELSRVRPTMRSAVACEEASASVGSSSPSSLSDSDLSGSHLSGAKSSNQEGD